MLNILGLPSNHMQKAFWILAILIWKTYKGNVLVDLSHMKQEERTLLCSIYLWIGPSVLTCSHQLASKAWHMYHALLT